MLENDLNKFIAVQKKDHFLYRLKKDIRKRFQMMTNMLITQGRLAALTQRIKDLQISKINSKNKFRNDRDLNFESCLKSTKQRSHRNDTMSNRTNQTDNSMLRFWQAGYTKGL